MKILKKQPLQMFHIFLEIFREINHYNRTPEALVSLVWSFRGIIRFSTFKNVKARWTAAAPRISASRFKCYYRMTRIQVGMVIPRLAFP